MEHDKGQEVRLLDVFVLGPFLVWAGSQDRELSNLAKWALVLAGIGTIVLNGLNFLRTQQGVNDGTQKTETRQATTAAQQERSV